jgi:hypothetical protein
MDILRGISLGEWLVRELLCALSSCILLTGYTYGTGPTQVAPDSEVGGIGNIRYDHKQFDPNTHMLKVHVSPGVLETETSMSHRMIAYANNALRACRA